MHGRCRETLSPPAGDSTSIGVWVSAAPLKQQHRVDQQRPQCELGDCRRQHASRVVRVSCSGPRLCAAVRPLSMLLLVSLAMLLSSSGISWMVCGNSQPAGRRPLVRGRGWNHRLRVWDQLVGALFGPPTPAPAPPPPRPTPDTPLPAGPDAPLGFDSEKNVDLPVLRYPHPALRRKNQNVEEFDGRLQKLADNLFCAMYAEGDDSIGLAAPQVGVNLRVMVYNPNPSTTEEETVFVNPKIVDFGGHSDIKTESCLSFPHMSGPVKRARSIKVNAVDLYGVPFSRTIRGTEARIFQHEYDHLEGVVYIDRLADSVLCGLQPNLDLLTQEYVKAGGENPTT